jgi:hypothetical protein
MQQSGSVLGSDDPDSLFESAQVAYAAGDFETATKHFEAALSAYQGRNQIVNVAACCNNLRDHRLSSWRFGFGRTVVPS